MALAMMLMALLACGDERADLPDEEIEAAKEAAANIDFAGDIQPIMEKFCYPCHSKPDVPNGINLAANKTTEDFKQDKHMVEELVEVMEENRMPPKAMPQPSDEEKAKILVWAKGLLAEM